MEVQNAAKRLEVSDIGIGVKAFASVLNHEIWFLISHCWALYTARSDSLQQKRHNQVFCHEIRSDKKKWWEKVLKKWREKEKNSDDQKWKVMRKSEKWLTKIKSEVALVQLSTRPDLMRANFKVWTTCEVSSISWISLAQTISSSCPQRKLPKFLIGKPFLRDRAVIGIWWRLWERLRSVENVLDWVWCKLSSGVQFLSSVM